MAKLWTDLIEPQELTEYARLRLAEIEAKKGNLTGWLPNRPIDDVEVTWREDDNSLVELAKHRAFDTEPEIAGKPGGKKHHIELGPIAQQIPVSERDQIRAGASKDEKLRNAILDQTERIVQSISDLIETERGKVLDTARYTVDEHGIDDDYGRNPDHSVVVPNAKKWTDPKVSRIEAIQEWADKIEASTGVPAGCMVMSRKVLRLLQAGEEFKTNLIGGGSRPATLGQVNEIIESAGLPPIHLYTRRTSAGLVLPENKLFLLPEPVEATNYLGTKLGATIWGETLTSKDPAYSLATADQPGLVVGTYRNPTPPMLIRVIADSIAAPIMFNPDFSFVATVA